MEILWRVHWPQVNPRFTSSNTNMDDTPLPITGVDELEKHLQQLLEDPGTLLNAKLFDEVELQLTGT